MNTAIHPIVDLHFAFPVTDRAIPGDDEDETRNPFDDDNLPLEDDFGDEDFPSEDEALDDEAMHVVEEGDENKDKLLDGGVQRTSPLKS